jgi:hypothetical protein
LLYVQQHYARGPLRLTNVHASPLRGGPATALRIQMGKVSHDAHRPQADQRAS